MELFEFIKMETAAAGMQQLSIRKVSGNTEKINEAVEDEESIKLVLRRLVTGFSQALLPLSFTNIVKY